MNQPCECGHAAADHWQMPPKCRASDCDCTCYRPASDSTEGHDCIECPIGASLATEAERLKRELRAANKGAETNAKVNQLLVGHLAESSSQLTAIRTAIEDFHKRLDWVLRACTIDRDAKHEIEDVLADITVVLAKAAAALSKAQDIGKTAHLTDRLESGATKLTILRCDDCGATWPDNEIGRAGYWSHYCQ